VKFSTTQAPLYPWAFYPAANGRPLFAINFDWMHKRGKGVPDAVMAEFLDAIAALPGVAAVATGVQELEWAKRPSVPDETLFADPRSKYSNGRWTESSTPALRASLLAVLCRNPGDTDQRHLRGSVGGWPSRSKINSS
jgi:hypothetical protein